jgi:hypothetical protein
VPHNVGHIERNFERGDLQFTIHPNKQSFREGETIEFVAEFKNISSRAIWIPKDIYPLFLWYYPTGQKDGLLPSSAVSKKYTNENAVLLKPNQIYSVTRIIRTHYFPGDGIVEFRAIITVNVDAGNSLTPFWTGRMESNAYGVLVSNSRRNNEYPSRHPLPRSNARHTFYESL